MEIHPQQTDGVYIEALNRGFRGVLGLRDLSLVAEPGQVYVVLGAAGSGKTTLLRCIAGELEPEKGKIRVCGEKQNSGPNIGYMPQPLGLFKDLTVIQNLVYFGELCQMTDADVKNAFKRLKKQLDLPEPDDVVANISRGRQRLVSLACALQHHPKVILLDAPVAGLDVLRCRRVWSLLNFRATQENATVIVTSHSTEDCRFADKVGFLRCGRLLTEGRPDELCAQYDCKTLEGVFSSLCLKDDSSFLPIVRKSNPSKAPVSADFSLFEAVTSSDDEDQGGGGARNPASAGENDLLLEVVSDVIGESARLNNSYVERSQQAKGSWKQVTAVLKRLFWSIVRAWILFISQLVLPTVQALIFLLFVGNNPMYLPVAVFRDETSGVAGTLLATLVNATANLETSFFLTAESAVRSVITGDTFAALLIPSNFTVMLDSFMTNPLDNNLTKVQLMLDYGDYQVTTVIEKELQKAFGELFALRYQNSDLDFYQAYPVYGDQGTEFIRFISGGYLCYTAFCFAMFVTVLTFLYEKRNGCLERAFSTGLKSWTLLTSHIIMFSVIILIQTMSSILVIIIFSIPVQGSYGLLILIMFLVALSGMSTGLVISLFSSQSVTAIQAAVGVSFLLLSIGGVLWPLLSVSAYASWVSFITPVSWASDAFRGIATRSYSINHFSVYMAVLVPLLYSFVCAVVCFINLKSRKHLCCPKRNRAALQS